MILDPQQLKDIVLNNPNKALVQKAKEKNKRYRMHMYGVGMESYITTIKGFEENALRELRLKYTKSNRDFFSRLSRPIDKVFSARGGSVYYNLPERQNEAAMRETASLKGGYSVRRWIETFWKPHFLDDPCGFILMEIGNGMTYPAGKAYPTYQAITNVYDYKPNGSSLEYVVLYVSNDEKKAAGLKQEDRVYRVIDDAFDYYVKVRNKEVEVVKDQTFVNYFMRVPAMLNSDFVDPNCDDLRCSLFDDIIELADEYLLKGSIKVTHDFLHAFPKYWEYADNCSQCNGLGVYDKDECKQCNGSGKSATVNVSQAKLMSWPESKDSPVIAPHVAGYVEPSEVFYKISTADKSMLEDMAHITVWGASGKKQTTGLSSDGQETKTATEVIEDLKPEHDRLHPITDAGEKRAKFIADCTISQNLSLPAYRGCSYNLGRRYLTESPDTIWKRYTQAKQAGASVSLLDELYMEFLETKYGQDPVSMEIMLKLAQVEPFVHSTIEQVKGLNLPEEDYLAKLYYGEWLATINDSEILVNDVIGLRAMLTEYVSGKSLPVEQPEPIAA